MEVDKTQEMQPLSYKGKRADVYFQSEPKDPRIDGVNPILKASRLDVEGSLKAGKD